MQSVVFRLPEERVRTNVSPCGNSLSAPILVMDGQMSLVL